MHADEKLSQEDMHILNKYMVNKLATLFTLAFENDWIVLEQILSYDSLCGCSWDEAEPDMEEDKLYTES